jgi:hypothetical protein
MSGSSGTTERYRSVGLTKTPADEDGEAGALGGAAEGGGLR